jgi:hypothetical protein
VLHSYLLDSPVIAEDLGVLELEARWMPLLWEGLQQLEEAVSRKQAAATTYEQMGVFNRAHKDILGLCAALWYMGRRVLRCLPKRIKAEGDSYVLLREQHPGVLAVLEDPDWPEYERKMLQLQELQERVDRSGVQDGAVAMLLRGARALPHLQLQCHATAVPVQHMAAAAAAAATTAADAAGAAGAEVQLVMPQPQLPPPGAVMITGLLLADGRVVTGDPRQLLQLAVAACDTTPAGTAAPPQLQPGASSSRPSSTLETQQAQQDQQAGPTPAPVPDEPNQPPGSAAMGSMVHAGADTLPRGTGLRGKYMRPPNCAAMLQEKLGVNGGPSWADQRKRKRAMDRNASAKHVSTYKPLDEAVQYAMREHGISESAAVDKLDNLRTDLGLTVHQTTKMLIVVRSLRWQVHNHIPEHPAHPSEEYAHYPPTELPDGEATPVPGATKVTALQAVRAVKAWGLCPDLPDECWFDSRLPSMRPECWTKRRKSSKAAAS